MSNNKVLVGQQMANDKKKMEYKYNNIVIGYYNIHYVYIT